MAKGYDEHSGDHVAEYADVKETPADTWAALVTHITGYPVPDRSTIFDTLRSDHGGKLFRMDIQSKSLDMLTKDSGFLMNKGEDYDIWFFDSGKKYSIRQARIVFEGRVKAGDEVIFASPNSDNVHDAQVRGGNEFTDYNKDKMSTVALARYMNGPRAALLELLTGNTKNARFSDLGVPEAGVVDLTSFNKTGDSFDFAAKFFTDHAGVLKDWEDRFGGDGASWKGEAAEVFRSLLKKIRENYDSYVETFKATSSTGDEAVAGKTVYSQALSLGRTYLENAANDLLDAWLKWANSPYYDPHQVLRYILDELARWVDKENVDRTEIQSYTSQYITTISHKPKEGFTQVHPEYGDLTDIANWAKVGDAAVKLWSQGVDDYLTKPAAKVQSALNNHFLDLGKDFSDNIPEPKSTSTASEEYEKKKLKEEQDEAKAQRDKDKADADKLRDEANAQRAEDKAEADKLRAEAEAQRAEDKAYADKLRAEAEAQRAEDKAEADKLRDEANAQRAEDKAYAEKLRAEQQAEADEAKRQADEQAKALGDSLGGLNGPGGGNEVNLGGLDDLLNGNKPVTESLGSLGDVNNPGGDGNGAVGDANKAVFESLGAPGDLNSPGGVDGNQQGPSGGPLPVSQNLGGLGAVNGGAGGTNKAANDAITRNLGGLGDLNTGGGSPLTTPTGGNTQLDDGRLTTEFPDGSRSTFDPDNGLLTTTHPDSGVTTQNLTDGMKVTNPDGSVTSLGDDGKLTTTFPDGTSQVVDPATGQAVTTDPDGRTTTQNLGSLGNLNSQDILGGPSDTGGLGDLNSDLPTESIGDLGGLGNLNSSLSGLETPTGGHTSLVNDDFSTLFPDGSKGVFDPNSGSFTMTGPDGSTVTTDLTHGATVNNPDGSTTALDNGQLTNTFPDGSKQVIDPDTGIATITDPQGQTRTVDLHDLNTGGGRDSSGLLDGLGGLGGLNGSSGLDGLGGLNGSGGLDGLGGLNGSGGLGDLGGLNGSGGLGSGGGTTTGDVQFSNLGSGGGQTGTSGLGGGLSPDGAGGSVDPLSDGATSGTGSPLAASAQSGTPGAPGTPGSPGMPMGGGMGGMGGGGDKGNGERVRAVLVDAAEESERRNRRRRSPWNRQEDSDTFLAPASRVATTGGESPEEKAEPGRKVTTSADYLEEDADVWGTEEGGTPSVIGR
ncbi:AAWKG family protein [Streptomyces sp. NPDC056796]|uniref:AAWKG family protein n=1 Tax=Streptomyces sp. NPDC056796 TaxID=3345947 RepID=UPI003689D40D